LNGRTSVSFEAKEIENTRWSKEGKDAGDEAEETPEMSIKVYP
jgi:hypothetical protein